MSADPFLTFLAPHLAAEQEVAESQEGMTCPDCGLPNIHLPDGHGGWFVVTEVLDDDLMPMFGACRDCDSPGPHWPLGSGEWLAASRWTSDSGAECPDHSGTFQDDGCRPMPWPINSVGWVFAQNTEFVRRALAAKTPPA